MPFGGRNQRTPAQVMAALLPVLPGQETDQASVMAWGFDPEAMAADPYRGAYNGVVTSLAKLVAAGADYRRAYLTLQEFFEKLREDPARWGKPFAALLGALDAQLDFGAAAIGGKDSMSGTFNDLDVPPTLISFAIAPHPGRGGALPRVQGGGTSGVPLCSRQRRRPEPEGSLGDLPPALPGGQGVLRLGGGARHRRGDYADVLR